MFREYDWEYSLYREPDWDEPIRAAQRQWDRMDEQSQLAQWGSALDDTRDVLRERCETMLLEYTVGTPYLDRGTWLVPISLEVIVEVGRTARETLQDLHTQLGLALSKIDTEVNRDGK